jgi:precorrin-3B synthase
VSRDRDDACPGALHVHQAADGALARIRLPGGTLTPTQLAALALAASEYGSGTMELTSRGNVQLRGITDTTAVADAVQSAGLLPSPSHERVRNIVCSPLSGRYGGQADVRPWVIGLDAMLQADPELASLPGRFLFSIDDGRGDVATLGADVGVQLIDDHVALLIAGQDSGIRLGRDEAVDAMLLIARRFAKARDRAWRIAELPDRAALLEGFTPAGTSPMVIAPYSRPPVGWVVQDDDRVALGAALPLGVLSARQAQFVAAIEAPVVITPWRSLLICDLDEGIADTSLRVLAPMGLVFDENSPWLAISSCVGSPGCDRALTDVRAAASHAAQRGDPSSHGHYVGCERACGSPTTGPVLMATGAGFTRIDKSPTRPVGGDRIVDLTVLGYGSEFGCESSESH